MVNCPRYVTAGEQDSRRADEANDRREADGHGKGTQERSSFNYGGGVRRSTCATRRRREETEGIATDAGEERGQREDSEGLPQELQRIDAEKMQLREQLVEQQEENTRITEALEREQVRVCDVEATSTARIEELSSELKKEREKARVVWRLNCEQIAQ